MPSRHILGFALAVSLAVAPVTQAAADAGNILGGVVGGIIGGAIVNSANKKRPPRTRVVRPSVSSATRAANRETQTALNYFGFPAGTPDGVLGAKSRSAVSGMQAFLAFPVTGNLTPFERDILVAAYHRGLSGSFETVQLISKDPLGPRALLVAQKDMMTGATSVTRRAGYPGLPIEVSDAVDEIAESSDPSAEQLLQRSGFIQLADLNGDGNTDYILDTGYSGSSFWCSSAQCKTLVFVSTSLGYIRNDLMVSDPTPASFRCLGSSCTLASPTVRAAAEAPEVAPPAQTETVLALGTLPLIGATGTGQGSLSTHCSKVSLLTNANGGFTTVSAMTDPDLVLSEQFCLARAYALDEGERMVAALQGVTQAQVDAQCAAYGPALKDYVSALSLRSRDEVVREVGGFVLSSGIDPAQLTSTARICLSVGYRTDAMDIALGSALLLVVLGEPAYGELMGHHLSQGFGTTKRDDLSVDWYDRAIEAMAQDGAVFAPAQTERPELLEAAVRRMRGDDTVKVVPAKTKSGASLPTFNTKN